MRVLNKTGAGLALVLAGLISGCGGGGSGGGAAFVSGTAATGAAIAAGTVTLKCVSGTTSAATTGTDGSFRVDVGSATLPCLVRVSYRDGGGVARTLHSIATTAGTANVTPVTELLLASLTGGTPATAFDSFDASRTRGYTATQISTAIAAMRTYLGTTLGVDTTHLPADPLGASLRAAVGAAAGDDFDRVLDDLAAKLVTAGKTLGDATATLGAGGGGAGGGGGGGGAAGTLTVTAASNSVRNGSYTPLGNTFTSGSDIGFNGTTTDNRLETEVRVSSTGAVKVFHLWFTNGGSPRFFGCDGGLAVPCTGVSWNAVSRQVVFSAAALAEVNIPMAFDGSAADTLTSGGETLTLNGSLTIP